MPKVPKGELGEHFENEGIDLKDDEIMDKVGRDLLDLEDDLRPKSDFRGGAYYEEKNIPPYLLEDRIFYLREEVDSITDREKKKQMMDRIKAAESNLYVAHLKFIESQIDRFGWRNSPLEEHYRIPKLDPKEVEKFFEEAKEFSRTSKLPQDKKEEFDGDLISLQVKFQNYQKEPSFYSFEKIEAEIAKEMYYFRVDSGKVSNKTFGGGVPGENEQKLMILESKIHKLKEISDRMLSDEIQLICRERLKYYERRVKDQLEKIRLPGELLRLEAELKDIIKDLMDGKRLAKDIKIYEKLISEFDEKYLQNDLLEKKEEIKKLYFTVKRLLFRRKGLC